MITTTSKNMLKTKSIIIIVAMLLISVNAFSAPLFQEKQSKWANEAVQQLIEKNIIAGYPNKTFLGHRNATRYELAVVIANFLELEENNTINCFNKEDLNLIKKLCEELKPELKNLNLTTSSIEKDIENLYKRIGDLDSLRFRGGIVSRYILQHIWWGSGDPSTSTTPTDYSTGRPIYNGNNLSSLLTFAVTWPRIENLKLKGGVEFAGWGTSGNPLTGVYYGLTPPYMSNPITIAPRGANHDWINLSLNKIGIIHEESGSVLKLGSFYPSFFLSSFLRGQKNPNAIGPEVLPMYGFNYTNQKFNRLYGYEIIWTTMGQSTNYNTQLGGISFWKAFKFLKGGATVTCNFINIQNEELCGGVHQGAGLLLLPSLSPFPGTISWRDDPSGATSLNIGPQKEKLFGLSLELRPFKKFTMRGLYGRSSYNADTTLTNFRKNVYGNLYDISLNTELMKFDISAEYLRIAPTYDPFLSRYPNVAGITITLPLFIPQSNFYSGYYQLHDNRSYPNNREGYRLSIGRMIKDIYLNFKYEITRQLYPSTAYQIQSIGNIEPVFSQISGGDSEKGYISNWSLSLDKPLGTNTGVKLNGSYYKTRRFADYTTNDIDSKIGSLFMGINHKFNPWVSGVLKVNYNTVRGHNVFLSFSDYSQLVSSLDLNYTSVDLPNDTGFNLKVFLQNLNYNDRQMQVKWNGLQGGCEFSYTF